MGNESKVRNLLVDELSAPINLGEKTKSSIVWL